MTRVSIPLDPGLPSLELLFDHDALSSLFGRRVRTSHLRWKRGVSAVTRLHDDDGVRWLALYNRESAVKLDKTSRRAGARGLDLEQRVVEGGVFASGPVDLDPRLYGPLRPFRRAGVSMSGPGTRVLKYNPFRRFIFSRNTGDGRRLVGRVAVSAPVMTCNMLSALFAAGVPVLVPHGPADLESDVPTGPHVQYLPWFGDGDLSTVPHERATPAARAAGAALAVLHGCAPFQQAHAWRAPAGRLRSLVRESAALMPEAVNRLQRVQTALEALLRHPGRAAVIHGDFSADQILVSGSSVRLIDFERCTYGAAASDLGSFAAVEALGATTVSRDSVLSLPRTAALLEGYGSGPTTVNGLEVSAWAAFHLLNRLHEPFRACAPDWRRQMDRRLGMIEEVLW